MSFSCEGVIAIIRMEKSKDSKQLSSHLVQCSLFSELGCCSFYFILSNHYWMRARVLCEKRCSVSSLVLLFSHIYIRVPAAGHQLLKHAVGASMKKHPHSLCSASMCLSCVEHAREVYNWPCQMSKIFSTHICPGRGHVGVSGIFSQPIYFPSLCTLHFIHLQQHDHYNSSPHRLNIW